MSEHDKTDMMLGLYEEVARLTGNMLSAAHQSDWDRLIELEAGCANVSNRSRNARFRKASAKARGSKRSNC